MSVDQIQPNQYQTQLYEKYDRIKSQFSDFDLPEIEVYESPDAFYRMRAEFKIWHEGDASHYAMYKPGEYRKPFIVDEFPVANKHINNLMPLLLDAINSNNIIRNRLFQAEFLTSQTNDTVITLIYHKALDEEWQEAATDLSDLLNANIIGRSKKQKLVIGRDYVEETLTVENKPYYYQQVEASFTQPNAAVCEKMLDWAVNSIKDKNRDFLELYCGNGNFTVPLSLNFRQVLATEISKTSVKSATHNFEKNNIENAKVVRMSSEEFSDAMDSVREFRRLEGINLTEYDFSTVLVDPPRAGLDEHTEQMVCRFDTILYISCNPDTLYKNLERICASHKIIRFALFDQFPYTSHIECGVVLSKR
jgi:tRNA (uracil-5-)-methyltransferase